MVNEALLRAFQENAKSAYRTLDTAMESRDHSMFELADGTYEYLEASIRSAAGKLGLSFTLDTAEMQHDRPIETLQLVVESSYGHGVAVGYILKISGDQNPEPNARIDSLMRTGLTLNRQEKIVLANTRDAYRLGRTLGYSENAGEVRKTFEQVKTLQS